jgi:hypothetical protein
VYEINSKIFLLSRCFILGRLSSVWINTFSHGRRVLSGGLSLIRAVLQSGKYDGNKFVLAVSVKAQGKFCHSSSILVTLQGRCLL